MLNRLEIHYAPDRGDSSGSSESLWGFPILTPELERKIKDELGEKWIRPTTTLAHFTRGLSRTGAILSFSDELSMLQTRFVMANIEDNQTTSEEFQQVKAFWKNVGIYPQGELDPDYKPSYFQSPDYLRHLRTYREKK